jgi:hypothetical protein
MGTPQNRLGLHEVVGCSICHNNGPFYEPANGTITAGWNDTLPTAAKCEFCHTGTNYTNHSLDEANAALQTMHDKLVNPIDGGVTSTCATSGCHNLTSLATKLAFHGTNDCLICHTSPAEGVQTVINNSKSGGAGTAPCESCHSTAGNLPNISYDWFLHVDYAGGIDHTTAGLVDTPTITSPPTVNCTSAACHGGVDVIDSGQPGTGVHDMGNNASKTYACALCHDGAGALINVAAGKGGGAECLTCHGAYFDSHTQRVAGSTGHAGVDPSYYTPGANQDWTLDDGPCGNCHKDATVINGAWDMNTWNGVLYEHDLGTQDGVGACAVCHDYNGSNGTNNNNVDGTHAVNAIAATPTAVTCGSCHDDKAQGGPDTVLEVSHGGHTDSNFGWDGNCDVCHNPFYPAAPNTTDNAVVRVVHGDTCGMCHTNPLLTNTAATEGAGSAVNGVDANANLADGDAGTWAAVCTTCHNTTTYPPATVHHDSVEWETNHRCENCHGPAANHHNLTTSYVNFLAADDRSQESDLSTTECDECHNDKYPAQKGTTALDTFEAIRYEHDIQDDAYETKKDASGGCVTCHNYITADANAVQVSYGELTGDPADGQTPVEATVESVILNASSLATASCVDCHTKKEHTQATSTHGGHSADFVHTASCSVCHTGADTLMDIHLNCDSCHTGSVYDASSNLVSTSKGDSTLAEGDAGTWNSQCTTCHVTSAVTLHHGHADVAAGNCDTCHVDPRPAYSGGANIPYKQLSCKLCHVVSDGASGIKVVQFELRDASVSGPSAGANGTRAGNIQSNVANHLFPNTPEATGVQNYGACFACHGKTGTATTKPVPFHALPSPTLVSEKNTVGDLGGPDFINKMGGGGFDISEGTGWSYYPSTGLDYRGGIGANKWVKAYFPLGKSVINIGWALYSQPKKATQNILAFENNGGLYNTSQFNLAANLTFGVVNNSPNNFDATQFIPVFDTTLPSEITDVITGTIGKTWTTGGGGAGPVSARTLTPNCTSTNGSIVHFIYGGIDIGSASGTLNNAYNMDTEAINRTNAASKTSLFHSISPGVAFCVSEQGGVLKVVNGQPAN